MPPTTIHVRPTGVPDETTPGIETRDLARLFRRFPALAGVSVRVEAGRAVAVLGSNGAGKSTLLRILATALRPSYGTAGGRHRRGPAPRGDPTGSSCCRTRERPVPTSPRPRTSRSRPPAADPEPGPGRPDRRRPGPRRAHGGPRRTGRRFSAGMRRRLALGRLLLGHPRLVLLDEPYAALDAEGMTLVDDLLDEWRANGATVLVATHAADRLAPGSTAGCDSSTGSWSRSAGAASRADRDRGPTPGRDRPGSALPAGARS